METTKQLAGAVEGFTVGQEVWFLWRGFARRGVIADFCPGLSNPAQIMVALRTKEDEANVYAYLQDVFSTELAAAQTLLRQAQDNVRYLKGKVQRLKREGGRP